MAPESYGQVVYDEEVPPEVSRHDLLYDSSAPDDERVRLTPQNIFRIARQEVPETDSPKDLAFHPIPSASQEIAMLRLLGAPQKGLTKTDVSTSVLLHNPEFLASISDCDDVFERQRWLYVLAATRTVKELVVACNQRLVYGVAHRTLRSMLPMKERIDGATDGLFNAIERYDPELINQETGRPYRLSSYAITYMKHGVQVRVCEWHGITMNSLSRGAPVMFHLLVGCTKCFNEFPSSELLEQDLLATADGQEGRPALSRRVIAQLMKLYRGYYIPRSLDQSLTHDSDTKLGSMAAGSCDVEEEAEQRMLRATVLDSVRALQDEGQRLLVGVVFGLDGGPGMSLRHAEARLGISAGQGQKLMEEAMATLRGNSALQTIAAGEGLECEDRQEPEPLVASSGLAEVEARPTGVARLIALEALKKRLLEVRDKQERVAFIPELARLGMNRTEIAQAVGLNRNTVSIHISRLALEGVIAEAARMRSEEKLEQRLAVVRRLVVGGEASARSIGQSMGVKKRRVHAYLKVLRERGEVETIEQIRQRAVASNPERAERLRAWLAENPFVAFRGRIEFDNTVFRDGARAKVAEVNPNRILTDEQWRVIEEAVGSTREDRRGRQKTNARIVLDSILHSLQGSSVTPEAKGYFIARRAYFRRLEAWHETGRWPGIRAALLECLQDDERLGVAARKLEGVGPEDDPRRLFATKNMESVVLDFMRSHDSVSRAEVVAGCDLGHVHGATVFRVLARLQAQGKVLAVGGKRSGRRYRLVRDS